MTDPILISADQPPELPAGVTNRDQLVWERLVTALGHFDAGDPLPCFCERHDAIRGDGSVASHQPRCRLARLALQDIP